MPSTPDLTVITPTIPGREHLLDECEAAVRRLGLPHLVGIDTTRQGPAPTRNRLLSQVDTSWVLFVDDDDLLLPNYLDVVTPHLSTSDVVYTSWDLVGAEEPQSLPVFDANLLAYRNFIPVTACVRTELLQRVDGFPTDAWDEDWALWRRLLRERARFRLVPEVAWVYRRFMGGRNEAPVVTA